MSESRARNLIDVFNRHDPAAFAAGYAPGAVAHDPQYDQPLRGRESIRQDMQDFFTAFPDIAGSIDRLFERGDAVAFDATMRGTHTGPLKTPDGEVPPTNRSVTFRAAIFCRFNTEGQVEEEHRYFDVASLMKQLGIAPQAAV